MNETTQEARETACPYGGAAYPQKTPRNAAWAVTAAFGMSTPPEKEGL